MTQTNDAFDDIFADDEEQMDIPEDAKALPWKVLIVDDEEDVHTVTKMALKGFKFEGRPLEFYSAFTGYEARKLLLNHDDAAIVLLDVVMEDDHAGLDTVKFIREDIRNTNIRIVLRTGQPGQAPETEVITAYDINDYKEKTELTKRKLFTLIYSLLRSYRDIMVIEKNKKGLEQIISATADVFQLQSMRKFATGVLQQMLNLLHASDAALLRKSGGFAAMHKEGDLVVLAGVGDYVAEGDVERKLTKEDGITAHIKLALDLKNNIYLDNEVFCYFQTNSGQEHVFYMHGKHNLTELDKSLLEIFTKNVAIAFQNVELHAEIEETQREIVYILGEAVETRSKETGNHVKRVAEISKIIALEWGMNAEEAEILCLASPLHDLGKIGIPDAILNKPARLDDAEMTVMRSHAELGQHMLEKSQRRILQAGAVIAGEHHERWDGNGYPNGKAGEDIHIYGRITAVADVYDALGSERCYKKAWPQDKVIEYFQNERGRQFDPTLVDILLETMPQIADIQNRYRDV